MTAPAIGQVDRYLAAGTTQIYWVGSIAVASAPTRLELDAGWDLSWEVADTGGWLATPTYNETTRFSAQNATSKPGVLGTDGTSLMMYADRAGDDIRAVLAKGANGNIVVFHGGDVKGRLMDVWPVQVACVWQPVNVGDSPAMIPVDFAVTGDVKPGLTVP
ncbi:phage tail tube protein [Glycomyces lechevalierae]|uniref:Uncharacterized protein n=1 Tax=Glycomyces lechevalierae TaxID=256034 RepID=A0ABU2AI35_9ACTN|nr:hypothetical protein [Glycomyces lechevalierae]MDR7336839.1 hypothetical protein [Glycomyces lechevalierae]